MRPLTSMDETTHCPQPGDNSERTDPTRIVGLRAPWLLLALCFFLSSTRAFAQGTACSTFSASGVNFGTYTGTVDSPGSSTISVDCPTNQTYNILLNQGQGSAATETVRQMTHGTVTLNYALYSDAAHTVNFGNTTGTGLYSGTGTGATQSIPFYPQLAAGQIVAPGTYTDTITASLGGSSSGSTTFSVTATVEANCTISASALAFGTYTFSSINNATSTLSVVCTNTTTYNVGLDAGTSSGASVTTRAMTGQTLTLLQYHVYSDTGRTTEWGNTIGSNTVSGTGTGVAQTLTTYDSIPLAQTVAPGTYTDTIVATVTY